MADYAFVVTQIGDKGSLERKRADEITDYILKPVLTDLGVDVERADRDPTPGRITPQLLRRLLEARVVIVDLTGRNANVYYELAVAHSFSKPTISLIDDPASLAFDAKDERTVVLGKYESTLAVSQAEDAKRELRKVLDVVLGPEFVATSLVSEVASARSLDDLAPENPVASELSAIREGLEELSTLVGRPRVAIPPAYGVDHDQMRSLIERLVDAKVLGPDELETVDQTETSVGFDNWLKGLKAKASPPDPWPAAGQDAFLGRTSYSDEPPF